MSGWTTTAVVLNDPLFLTSVRNNLVLMVCVPVMIVVALVLALLLYEQRKAAPLYRFILFTPYIISITVSGIAFSAMLTKNGALNQMLEAAGLGFLRQDWLGDPKIALLSVGAVIIWREAVLGVVLFVARLLSLSTEPLEAAMVDGATRWRAHWSVTLPQMRGIIGFYAITSVITIAVWTFSYVFVMTNGGPGNATMTADLYIYQNAFTVAQMNLAASAATLVLIAAIAVVAVAALIPRLRRKRETGGGVRRQDGQTAVGCEGTQLLMGPTSASRHPPRPRLGAVVQHAILHPRLPRRALPLLVHALDGAPHSATTTSARRSAGRRGIHWENFAGAFDENIGRWVLNSAIVTGGAVLLVTLISVPAAYAFVRLPFRGSALLLKLFVFLMVIPPIVMLLPLFSLMNALGRVNHFDAVIVAYAGLMFPFSVFMMVRYIETIPRISTRRRLSKGRRTCASSGRSSCR